MVGANELLVELRALDVNLHLGPEGLRYDAPAGVMTADLMHQLRACKAELVELVRPDDATVLGSWVERAAIQESDNQELIQWHRERGHPEALLRRNCELIAAAELALLMGDWVLPIIRPHVVVVGE
jgi:hypothetical protein